MDVQLKLYLYKGLMFKLYVRCAPGAGGQAARESAYRSQNKSNTAGAESGNGEMWKPAIYNTDSKWHKEGVDYCRARGIGRKRAVSIGKIGGFYGFVREKYGTVCLKTR